MGLFNFWGNYTKPGPGVEKDEIPKAAPIRFFQILGRKFGKMMQLNLIFMLPVLVSVFLMGVLFLFVPHFGLELSVANGALTLDVCTLYVVPFPLVLLSPFTAGLTYVTRNFSREEHAFVWSDFWTAVKNNWKYFLLNGLIIYLFYVIQSFAMIYYYNNAAQNAFLYAPFWICIVISVVFLFAQYYIPVMFVTFDLKFGQVYRNALIFVLAGFFRNLLLTVILAAIILVILLIPIMPLTIMILFFLVVLLLFSLISYLINFTIYPVIDQYLIQPYHKQQEEEKKNAPKLVKEYLPEEPEKDRYVYVNGKLVKRSQMEDEEKKEEQEENEEQEQE